MPGHFVFTPGLAGPPWSWSPLPSSVSHQMDTGTLWSGLLFPLTFYSAETIIGALVCGRKGKSL